MASKEEFESLSSVLMIAHDEGDIDDEELAGTASGTGER